MGTELQKIADMIGAEGNFPDITVKDVEKIDEAGKDEISFLHNPKYFSEINSTNAGAVIVPQDFETDKGICILKVKDPYRAFLKVLKYFHPEIPVVEKGIDPSSAVHETVSVGKEPSIGAFVSIGKNCRIGNYVKIQPNVTVSENVMIGDNVTLYANVSIREKCVIGNNVIIQNGAVIGSDGFGFAPGASNYDKIPQVGNVILEDNVEIGANTVIDRATLGSTVVRKGTKLDNLIQVAHNVDIGNNVVIAAQTGISGSTKIGSDCMVGGQVGFAGHIKVGDRVMIGAQAGVAGNVKDGSIVTGTPARDMKKMRRIDASAGRLPDLIYKVKELEKEIKKLISEE